MAKDKDMTEIIENYWRGCKIVFDYYGDKAQKTQLIQELGELIVAITKEDNENFIEELADVLVMIDQFIIAYPDLDDSVRATQVKKIERQLKRIEAETCQK